MGILWSACFTVFVLGCVLKDLKKDSARHFVGFTFITCSYFGRKLGAIFAQSTAALHVLFADLSGIWRS